jgi:hypothetical protein
MSVLTEPNSEDKLSSVCAIALTIPHSNMPYVLLGMSASIAPIIAHLHIQNSSPHFIDPVVSFFVFGAQTVRSLPSPQMCTLFLTILL